MNNILKNKCVVFDLDHTLFDHNRGENFALQRIFCSFRGVENNFEFFIENFKKYNQICWELFKSGEIDIYELLHKRFILLCGFYGIQDVSIASIKNEYIRSYIKECIPYAGVKELMSFLSDIKLPLAICSNGARSIQENKVKQHGLFKYFFYFQYGTAMPFCKPHIDFFKNLISSIGIAQKNIVFIGDSLEDDINPAVESGMQAIHINENYLQNGNLQWKILAKKITKALHI